MLRVDLQEAGHRLAELAEDAARGEDVIITRGDGVTFRLVQSTVPEARPLFGSANDQIVLSEDFDAPLEDFEDYAP